MDGGELLQTSHPPETEHRPLASSEGKMRILGPVVDPPTRLMADIDAPLMQKIFDIAKRKRKPDVEHHRQADDIRAGLAVLEWVTFRRAGTLREHPAPAQAKYFCQDHPDNCIEA